MTRCRLGLVVATLLAASPKLSLGAEVSAIVLADVRPVVFVAKQDLRFTVDPAALGSGTFRVRVFRGTISTLPSLGVLRGDGCREYETTLFAPRYRAGSRQLRVAGTNHGWLASNGHNGFASQTFVLIFENKGPNHPVIRIASRDLRAYFSRGVEITVRPDRYLPEMVEEQLESASANYTATLQRYPTLVGDCYELKAGMDEPGPVQLVACSESGAAAVESIAVAKRMVAADGGDGRSVIAALW